MLSRLRYHWQRFLPRATLIAPSADMRDERAGDVGGVVKRLPGPR